MIFELLQKAESTGLEGCESLRKRSIDWFIDLSCDGTLTGFSPTVRVVQTVRGERMERRGKAFSSPANYHMQWKNEKVQSVCTNDSNWLPDFLCGPANEIFPSGVSGDRIYRLREVINARKDGGKKHPERNRLYKLGLWRRLIFKAEKENPGNVIIGAVANYIRSPHSLRFTDLPLTLESENMERLRTSFDEGKEYISFRVNGQIAIHDFDLQQWWAKQVRQQRDHVIERLNSGCDMYLSGDGPITEYFPSVFGGVPFASFNAAPFVSYGLGMQTATFRLETAEKVTAAFNSLEKDPSTKLKLGEETAVFWAVEKSSKRHIPADFMQLLDQPDTLAVRDYLNGIWGGHLPEIEEADFHVAILQKGTGRFSVRSWHTDTLGNAGRHVKRYFNVINLPDVAEGVTLRKMAWVTIAKTKKQKTKPASTTYNALFESAWRGTPLPFNLLAATIERQRAELASGDPKTGDFRSRLAARAALIQLYFALKPDNPLETGTGMIMNAKDTAILCGRLLALLDEIHNKAHDGKSASSPANRLYGSASATPALVFPRLCELARYHLQKMDSGLAYKYEFGVPKERRDDDVQEDFEGLAAIVSRLKEASGDTFPRMLTLEDQGRFALGFYYERARQWPNFKRKEDGQSKPETTEES